MPFLNGQQAFCGYCKEPCEIIWIDQGIGPNEFWGVKSVHVDYQPESECCNASFWADELCTIEFDMRDWEPDIMEPDDDY